MKKIFICIGSIFLLSIVGYSSEKPNIVVILADDMGYGEIKCLNSKGEIKTPGLDAVAKNGMIFTDAHSGSSVCTPTRYGLITGRYAWRTRLQKGVLTGGDSLVKKETLTIADMLKTKGYDTAMIGKWHLGMKFDGQHKQGLGKVKVGERVTQGPLDCAGFDKFWGFHYARQMDLWIVDQNVKGNLKAVEMLPKLTETAEKYILERKGKDKPFFMYIPWNSPHSPVVPSASWKGKSGINDHADFVMETDHGFARVVKALKDAGKYENTLIICSSDNGTSPYTSGKKALIKAGHDPSAGLKGMKADIWEGGHRVPFIVSWPKRIKAGTVCNDLICLTDIMATAADITGYKFTEKDAVDSFSFLPSLLGEQNKRSDVIHHSINGLFAIREGKWKLACCPGSGGWGSPKDVASLRTNGADSPLNYQLYDMSVDKFEKTNLVEKYPDVVKHLRTKLREQIDAGRSSPGTHQKNDVKVVVDKWKSISPKKKRK